MGPRSVTEFGLVAYRRKLIERIRERGIDDLELLELFDRVPRHIFLPEGVQLQAYEDRPIPIGHGQTASQPSLQAIYLKILQPTKDDRVLEIGTGCGFLTALLAMMADRVYSVERVRDLSIRARKALDALAIRNVALLVGDGSIGWRKYAPYDVIVISAACPSVPPALVDQIAEGGRMLLPLGSREQQDLILVTKEDGQVRQEKVLDRCTFVPLLGRYGWGDPTDSEGGE